MPRVITISQSSIHFYTTRRFAHHAMHHALGQGRGHDQADIGTASRLAEDSYPVRITTEIRDVCLHPVQYLQLIEDAVVTGRIVFGLSSKGRMRKKTQRPQAIIGGNYYCAPRRQVGTVEYERTAVASGESQWITGPEAREDVQRLRARSSAIVTGIGTVLADRPSYTVRPEQWRHGEYADGPVRAPHSLAFDSQGRLFVADRGNRRIQIFDQDGTLLDSWTQFGRPSGLFIDQHDTLYVADSESRDNEGGYGHNPDVRRGIRIGSAVDGTVTGFIADPAERGGSSAAEGVAVDHDGNVYGAEVGPRDVKKYIKR